MNSKLRSWIATATLACVAFVSVPPPAHAQIDARAQAREQLIAYGVSPSDAAARVAVLTEAEVESLAAAIAELPAGGNQGAPILVLVAITALIVAPGLIVLTGLLMVAAASGGGARNYAELEQPAKGEFPASFTYSCPSGRCP